MNLTEFCKDMPEQQPYNEAEDPEMIEHPEIKGLWLSTHIPLSKLAVRVILLQFRDNIPLMKRIFTDCYNLHPQKELFIKELNKYVRINGSIPTIDSIIEYHRRKNPATTTKPNGNNLTHRQIALALIYNGEKLQDHRTDPDNKAERLVKENGHISPAKLCEHYNMLQRPTQRTGVPDKKRMIKDINRIMPQLNDKGQELAQTDLNKLNMNIEQD